ncbi:MAG: DUF2497 domain-containing protein [Candidatus Liberibacter europaeus]|uniref:DUF2497 domain-containing protein n=1 Tax=Candidatus Liberibacter europaeus TaxID=744859 RepID=A0A2T4VYG3_9HYPH|nr:DUF2497 domain-containing protein [Candidatus Liberibacter europaeus]PTL86818.1 MAG: DUF2497 domain-containing protein [Candidatus Liberibacter europaeus]
MAQSNAVYEPSMEEIVASIRRIIENNDQDVVVSNDVDNPVKEYKDNKIEKGHASRSQDGEWSKKMFADKNYRFTGQNSESSPKESPSLSDVSSRVRAESQGDYSRMVSEIAASMRDTTSNSEELVKEYLVDDKTPDGNLFSNSNVDMRADDSLKNYTDLSDGNREQEEAMLVSSETGNRVSSSFDQLVEALKETDSRSIDQLSADVLRPMLREWLDDNLPGIVERLVREEIERIARGSARR